MSDDIGIGFIGTGFTRLTQIPAFRDCAGATLSSIASARIANAKSVAGEFAIPHFTDDWKETIEKDDVNLVLITTPPNLHREMSLYAIERGKHVLCEKPMAMDAEEAREMTEAAEAAGVMALIDHELRFLNGRRRALEIVRNGGLGKIRHVKSVFRNASRGNPDLKWNWWSDVKAGGGALGAIGSHAIDGFHWLLGTRTKDISCLLKTNIKQRNDESGVSREVTSDDECNFILTFEDSPLTEDTSGTGSFSMVEIGEYDFRQEIYGSDAALIIGESGQLHIARKGEHEFTQLEFTLGEPPADTKSGGWSIGFLEFAKRIVASLKHGETKVPGAATFREGVEVQKVLDAARRSHETGKKVIV